MKKENYTRDMKYKKKFAAGKIIGLQNLIPGLAEKSEIIFFTENNNGKQHADYDAFWEKYMAVASIEYPYMIQKENFRKLPIK